MRAMAFCCFDDTASAVALVSPTGNTAVFIRLHQLPLDVSAWISWTGSNGLEESIWTRCTDDERQDKGYEIETSKHRMLRRFTTIIL